MRCLLTVVVVAACGSTKPAPTDEVANEARPVVRDSAPPKLGWDDRRFIATGLPAVAKAGEVAVVMHVENDTGRGNSNARIDVIDLNDRVTQKIEVLSADEYESIAPEGTMTPALQARIDSANAELAKLHQLHDLVPVTELEVQKPTDGVASHMAIGEGLTVDLAGAKLLVFRASTDRPFLALDATRWIAPPKPGCENPPFLGGAYRAPGIDRLIVLIAYSGTDRCWEPSSQHHVISW